MQVLFKLIISVIVVCFYSLLSTNIHMYIISIIPFGKRERADQYGERQFGAYRSAYLVLSLF